MVLQVGYQVLEGLLPFRRVRLIILVVCYTLRRKRDSWMRALAGSHTQDRKNGERRTSRLERRVHSIGRLLLAFS